MRLRHAPLEAFLISRGRKWVLSQNAPKGVLRGFYLDNKVAREFRIASPEESSENEVKYGENYGQISFTVFRENYAPEPEPLPLFATDAERTREQNEAEAERAVSRGLGDDEPPALACGSHPENRRRAHQLAARVIVDASGKADRVAEPEPRDAPLERGTVCRRPATDDPQPAAPTARS